MRIQSLSVAVIAAVLLAGSLSGCSKTGTALPSAASSGPAVAESLSDAMTTVTTTKTVTKTSISTPPVKTVTVTVTSTPTRPSSDSPPTGLIVGGAGVTASDSDGAADVLVLTVERRTDSLSDYSDPPSVGVYLIIEVEYTCTEGEFTYNPFDWTLRDAEGRTYDHSYTGYEGTTLDSGIIGIGSKARGALIFDAPIGALSLEYRVGFGAPAVWDIPA